MTVSRTVACAKSWHQHHPTLEHQVQNVHSMYAECKVCDKEKVLSSRCGSHDNQCHAMDHALQSANLTPTTGTWTPPFRSCIYFSKTKLLGFKMKHLLFLQLCGQKNQNCSGFFSIRHTKKCSCSKVPAVSIHKTQALALAVSLFNQSFTYPPVKVEIHDASFLENVNDHGNSMMTTSLIIKIVNYGESCLKLLQSFLLPSKFLFADDAEDSFLPHLLLIPLHLPDSVLFKPSFQSLLPVILFWLIQSVLPVHSLLDISYCAFSPHLFPSISSLYLPCFFLMQSSFFLQTSSLTLFNCLTLPKSVKIDKSSKETGGKLSRTHNSSSVCLTILIVF